MRSSSCTLFTACGKNFHTLYTMNWIDGASGLLAARVLTVISSSATISTGHFNHDFFHSNLRDAIKKVKTEGEAMVAAVLEGA